MKGAWGRLYGANDAGRNTKMQEDMIPIPPNKPYVYNGVGYDNLDEMNAAKERDHGVEDSPLVKLLKSLTPNVK